MDRMWRRRLNSFERLFTVFFIPLSLGTFDARHVGVIGRCAMTIGVLDWSLHLHQGFGISRARASCGRRGGTGTL